MVVVGKDYLRNHGVLFVISRRSVLGHFHKKRVTSRETLLCESLFLSNTDKASDKGKAKSWVGH